MLAHGVARNQILHGLKSKLFRQAPRHHLHDRSPRRRIEAQKKIGKSLFSVVQQIVGTIVSESRYLTADMELFASDKVFSRFQLVPFRSDGKVGEAALSGTSLFRPAGWGCRAFPDPGLQLGDPAEPEVLAKHAPAAGVDRHFPGPQP